MIIFFIRIFNDFFAFFFRYLQSSGHHSGPSSSFFFSFDTNEMRCATESFATAQ